MLTPSAPAPTTPPPPAPQQHERLKRQQPTKLKKKESKDRPNPRNRPDPRALYYYELIKSHDEEWLRNNLYKDSLVGELTSFIKGAGEAGWHMQKIAIFFAALRESGEKLIASDVLQTPPYRYCTLPNGTQGIEFGTYPQTASATWDDKVTHTPIQWRVLEKYNDGTALLLSDKILDCVPYHKTGGNIEWSKSGVREWLNNQFCNKAFDGLKSSIIQQQITGNGVDSKKVLAVSTDHVFLLNTAEADSLGTATYDPKRRAIGTPYAVKNNLDVYGGDDKDGYLQIDGKKQGCSLWWLRNRGACGPSFASFVNNYGHVHAAGFNVYYGKYGVRPAIRIKL